MTFDICAIGNACIDVIAPVPEEFLTKRDFQKSICTYLTLDRAEELLAALSTPVYIPGGCAANTAAVVAALGGRAGFMGRLADDEIGDMFLSDLNRRGIAFTGTADTAEGAGSTRIFTLMTPDAERTFAAYYGVQEDLSKADLDGDMIAASDILYLDGYALNATLGGETFLAAAEIAKKAGKLVAFSPNDLSIIEKYGEKVRALMEKTDIFLCNENEAMTLTECDTLDDAMILLARQFSFGAVTMGANGVGVFGGGEEVHVPCSGGGRAPVDLNGAGDAFAGGFLYGIVKNIGLKRAAILGNRCAERVIMHTGARAEGDYTPLLKDLAHA